MWWQLYGVKEYFISSSTSSKFEEYLLAFTILRPTPKTACSSWKYLGGPNCLGLKSMRSVFLMKTAILETAFCLFASIWNIWIFMKYLLVNFVHMPLITRVSWVGSWPPAHFRHERGGAGKMTYLISSSSGRLAAWPNQWSLLWTSCDYMLLRQRRRRTSAADAQSLRLTCGIQRMVSLWKIVSILSWATFRNLRAELSHHRMVDFAFCTVADSYHLSLHACNQSILVLTSLANTRAGQSEHRVPPSPINTPEW